MVSFILERLLPISIAIGTASFILNFGKERYRRFDMEAFVPQIIIIAIIWGMHYLGWYGINQQDLFSNPIKIPLIVCSVIVISFVLFIVSGHLQGQSWLLRFIIRPFVIIDAVVMIIMVIWKILLHFPLTNTFTLKFATTMTSMFGLVFKIIDTAVHSTIAYYLPFYITAFIGVTTWIVLFASYGLRYQITLASSTLIWIQTIAISPYLMSKYLLGYETPYFDFVASKTMKARLRTANSQTSQNASRGGKVDTGTGGDIKKEELEAIDFAIKNSHITFATKRRYRRVRITLRLPAATSMGERVTKALSGFGRRVNFKSVVLQADPTPSDDGRTIFFNSEVPYASGEELGEWKTIFVNPFENDKDSIYYKGPINSALSIFKGVWHYITHLTPQAVYERLIGRYSKIFKTSDIANSEVPITQANLDLSLIPEALNANRETVAEATKKAERTARSWIDDMSRGLSQVGLSGTFKDVTVGGAVAMYSYEMPADSDFPTQKHAEKLANILGLREQLDIVYRGGILTVSRATGVMIPVSFDDMVNRHPKTAKNVISGVVGLDALGNPVLAELGDGNPHAMLFGKTGSGKTVTIMAYLFSLMHFRSPNELKFIFIDGKGNSFEFMKNSPYTMLQPADGNNDLLYTQSVVAWVESEVRRRIDIFKKAGVSKIREYNKRFPENHLPDILVVFDEFSSITDKDGDMSIPAAERSQRNVIPRIDYIAKMARSAGIRLLMANQTARAEKVPGVIKANITAYISLSVAAPIESDIALPEAIEKPHLLTNAGDSFVMFNGINDIKRSQSPFIKDEIMDALVDGTIQKFGTAHYVMDHEQVIEALGLPDEDEQRGLGTRPTNTRASITA